MGEKEINLKWDKHKSDSYLDSSKSSASVATAMSKGWAKALICHASLTASRMNGWMTAKVMSGGRKILGLRFKDLITSCTKHNIIAWLNQLKQFWGNKICYHYEEQNMLSLWGIKCVIIMGNKICYHCEEQNMLSLWEIKCYHYEE